MRKQRNRAMMIGNHKGHMHIDTPLPNDPTERASQHRSNRSISRNKDKARSRGSSTHKYSKADTKFRPEYNFELTFPKKDSLEVTRQRGRSSHTARERRQSLIA